MYMSVSKKEKWPLQKRKAKKSLKTKTKCKVFNDSESAASTLALSVRDTAANVPATTSVGLKQSRQQHKNLRACSGFGYQECWQILLQWDINSYIRHVWVFCRKSMPHVSWDVLTENILNHASALLYSGQCTWLEVHQNSTWHIAATCCLVEVNVDALLIHAAMQSRKANHRHQGWK